VHGTSWADELEFRFLRDTLQISDSLRSRQASTLGQAGYVAIRMGHVGRWPRTGLVTPEGRAAFDQHVATLREIVETHRRRESIPGMSDLTTTVGTADPSLDERLNDELSRFNAAATPDVAVAQELTVKVLEDAELIAGASGWTWGQAAGIAMTWVRDDHRGTGVGARLLGAFEDEARRRGCTHVFVTSFTFQAPAFYERQGYDELFRWASVPTPGRDDVHLRKQL
jgi:GNAT superfamily N-acetyltransferase